MSRLPKDEVYKSFWEGDTFDISFDSCYGRASISVEEREKQSVITLDQLEYRCPTKPTPDDMRQHFEKEFIDKLREEPVTRSPMVLYISSPTIPAASNAPSP
jgi:hypothetical protein